MTSSPAAAPPPADLILLVGLPASGKSTFYQRRFAATHRHVSKDLLRSARSREARQRELIAEALREGRSVVVDNVNARVADRAPLIELARAHRARVHGYFFEAPVAACLTRNRQREGRERVPDVAIFAAAKRLERPTYAEGFDALFEVRVTGGDFEVTPWPAARTGAGA